MKKIAVFTSSANNLEEMYFKEAEKIANLLVQYDFDLVYGGGSIGLMKIFSDIFYKNGKKIIGVITKKLHEAGVGAPHIAEEYIIVDDLFERKKIMINNADIFLIFPGGIGTIDEFLDILALKQLQYHSKPIIVYNFNNLFNSLLEQFEILSKKNFIDKNYRSFFYETKDYANLQDLLNKIMCRI